MLTVLVICAADCSCVYFTGVEIESETENRQSKTSLVWVVVLLLSFGVTIAAVVTFFWCCCYWQRRRPLMCCEVMVRRDATKRRELLQSLVGPPLRKRILFMRNNILYASDNVPAAKVRPSSNFALFLAYVCTLYFFEVKTDASLEA